MSRCAFKYRFHPTDEQRELLAKTFGCTRFVYNTILSWRTDAFFDRGESIGYAEANAKLSEIKRSGEYPWLSEVSSVPLQQCLRHQQQAYTNFFAGRTRYPTFRSKHRRQSIEFSRSGFRWCGGQLTLAKCSEALDIRWSRPVMSEPSTVTVSMDTAGRYFVSLLCEFEPEALPITPRMVGVDVGIAHLAVLSTGRRSTTRSTRRASPRSWHALRRRSRRRGRA